MLVVSASARSSLKRLVGEKQMFRRGFASSVAVPVQAIKVRGNDPTQELVRMNEELENVQNDPIKVIEWAMQEFDGRVAMSTSFGIQSAVLLHLATQVKPDVDVVWVDTGYLPEETYQYAQTLQDTLGINLHVASNSEWSPARMEAVYGKLWTKEDVESHTLYGKLRKVDPMKQGLDSLSPNPLCLLSGLRAAQTKARANMKPIGFQQGRYKLLPMLKMSDDDVVEYMDRNDLPAHPLQAKGYVTVGDWHSSRPVEEGEDPRNTRFGGKFQECGLHVDTHETEQPLLKKQEEEEVELLPESLQKTGIKSLGVTHVHPETDIAVIMVKKLTEDGSFCRKCNDVAQKMDQDNITHLIGHQAVANVLDKNSEGSKLAKHFGVVTAPFFLIRTAEEEQAKKEWRVVRSYLQLRKMLEKAIDRKLSQPEDTLQNDPVYKKTLDETNTLKSDLEKLEIQILEKRAQLETTEKTLSERKKAFGLV